MKHVIIAGTARAGKTSLCYSLNKRGFVHLKLDSLKRAICEIYNDKNNWKDFSPKTALIINRVIKEIDTDTIAGKEYYAIDTCHLLPIDALKIDNSKALIIFIGYSALTPNEEVKNIREHDLDNYWTKSLTDEELYKMSEENIEFSRYIKQECEKLNIKYYDTSYNRDEVLNSILDYIKNNI